MKPKIYNAIIEYYESCFEKYGDNYFGVGWNNQGDVNRRFKIMLELIKSDFSKTVRLLDFGCGTAMLYEYIQHENLGNIVYSGLDMSQKYIKFSKEKYPQNNFYALDILEEDSTLPQFDYVVMNGVFTQKIDIAFDQMFDYMKEVVLKVFKKADKGIAFNLMSKEVDWENDGNFYLSFDLLAKYLTKYVSRNFIIRHDYGLYEYTTYVYK